MQPGLALGNRILKCKAWPCRMMSKVMRALTELRQACCHPQIVRRQDALLGQQRLSMEQILARLTTQAFSHYDNAVRGWVAVRIIRIAAQAHFSKKIGEDQAWPCRLIWQLW